MRSRSITPAPIPAALAVVVNALGDEPLAGLLVQNGGDVVEVALDAELAERGVVLCSLEEAMESHGDLVREHFMSRLTYERDKFEAAAAAFWTGGRLPARAPDLVVERPFQIVYAIDRPGSAQYAHTLAIGGRGSDFRLREYDLGGGFDGQALHAGQFELYLQDGARCRLVHLQDWGAEPAQVHDVSTHFVRVGRDAHCTWTPIHLGGHLTRQHLELSTAEPGADMRHRGIYFTEGSEHLGPVHRRPARGRSHHRRHRVEGGGHRRQPRVVRGADQDRARRTGAPTPTCRPTR